MTRSWHGFLWVALAAGVTASLVGCNAETDRMRPADAMVREDGSDEPDDPLEEPDWPYEGTPDERPNELPPEFPIEPPNEQPSHPTDVSPADPPEVFPPDQPVAGTGDPIEPDFREYPPPVRKGDPGEPGYTEPPPLETPRKGDPAESYPDWPDPVAKSGDGDGHARPNPGVDVRPGDPVEHPRYPAPVDPPPSHLAGQPRFPIAGGPDVGIAAQVPPRHIAPLPAYPDTENPLRTNPLRSAERTPRRGDLPAELLPPEAAVTPHGLAAEPDRVAVQPSDPSPFRRPPVPAGEPLHGGSGSTTLPPDARLPVPIVPAPFGPGDSPRFAPGDRQPPELSEGPPMEMAVREPLEAVAEPHHVESEPHAMIRETPQPAESAMAPSDVSRSADEINAGTETEEKRKERERKADEDFDRVTVYYGTDRANLTEIERSQLEYLTWLKWAGLAFAGTIGVAVMNLRFRRNHLLQFLLVFGLLSTIGLGAWSAVRWLQVIPAELQPQYAYGGKPGKLKYGTCDVSIPKTHERGKLEAPSLIWGEFQPDPEKHVYVLDSLEMGEAEFFERLRECVADSEKKQAFVFIHGYNVSFEDAIRRTAQLAFDLRFDGAPICYSWPSQANTFLYATDAESVVDTEDHLHQFLVGIQKKSGAEKIHLIAHSMGNRCLTAVLHDMARDREKDSPPFDEIVLTAPDVRASIFRRRAPDIVKMANRVTLYASSNDAALKISQEIQTFPRAGETGKDKEGNDKIVVVDGIDTIDVSSVDTSLLGHTYYGDNTSVLSDLFHVIQFGQPAADRNWLKPKPFEDSRYWILLSERIGGRPTTENR